MAHQQPPFLRGALAWIYEGDAPPTCPTCGWTWSAGCAGALEAIASAPDRYVELLAGRDGMAQAADGGWNATAYPWHLTDLGRSWAEHHQLDVAERAVDM